MNSKIKNMVFTAVLIALICLLGFTPVGMIPLGFINISILAIPVIIGTVMLGLKNGLVLGACFGAISALSAFGIYGTPSSLASALVAANPVIALVICFVPRLLVPVFAHLVYKLASHRKLPKESIEIRPTRAVFGTVIYLVVMFFIVVKLGAYLLWYVDAAVLLSAAGVYLLLFKRRQSVALAAIAGSLTNTVFYLGLMLLGYVIMGIDSASILALIGGTGLVAGSAEAVAAAFICTGVCLALNRSAKKVQK